MPLADSFSAFLALRAKYPGHTQVGGAAVEAALDNLVADIRDALALVAISTPPPPKLTVVASDMPVFDSEPL